MQPKASKYFFKSSILMILVPPTLMARRNATNFFMAYNAQANNLSSISPSKSLNIFRTSCRVSPTRGWNQYWRGLQWQQGVSIGLCPLHRISSPTQLRWHSLQPITQQIHNTNIHIFQCIPFDETTHANDLTRHFVEMISLCKRTSFWRNCLQVR